MTLNEKMNIVMEKLYSKDKNKETTNIRSFAEELKMSTEELELIILKLIDNNYTNITATLIKTLGNSRTQYKFIFQEPYLTFKGINYLEE